MTDFYEFFKNQREPFKIYEVRDVTEYVRKDYQKSGGYYISLEAALADIEARRIPAFDFYYSLPDQVEISIKILEHTLGDPSSELQKAHLRMFNK